MIKSKNFWYGIIAILIVITAVVLNIIEKNSKKDAAALIPTSEDSIDR